MDSRPRKTTMEAFNDELAVLDRPLENDVEYFDEKPPSRWRGGTSILVGIIAIGAASGLAFVKMRSSKAATAEAAATAPAQPAAAPAAPAVAPSPALAVAAPPAPAPAAAPDPEEAADAPADEPAVDEPAPKHAPSRAEWAKIRTKTTHSTHATHARSGGGKVVYRRTTMVKRHVVKRTVSGRH